MLEALTLLQDEKMTKTLQEKWNLLANEIALEKSLYTDFIYWYSTPHREYHNLHHVYDCLNEFEDAETLVENRHAVELAIWFHDAIYDTHRTDNEEESTKLAYEVLRSQGLSDKGYCQHVRNLILLTKHIETPDDTDGKTLLDIDLSILGRPEKEFDQYENNIRREYIWVPEEHFRKGRAAVLHGFLERPDIYLTDFFRDKYEAHARSNLQRSLEKLNG